MSEEKREVGELRELFKAIMEFIDSLKKPMKEIMDYVYQQLDGEKIGMEIGKFYNQLIQQGVPKELAEKMTMEYMKARLEVAKNAANITKLFGGGYPKMIMAPRKKGKIKLEFEEKEEEEKKGEGEENK